MIKDEGGDELDTVSMQLQHEKEVAAKNKRCRLGDRPGEVVAADSIHAHVEELNPDIFIYATGNALVNPLKSIGNMKQVFGKFDKERVDTRIPKLIFIAMQLLSVGVALYKCATMSLLPLTSADWLWRLGGRQYENEGGIPIQ